MIEHLLDVFDSWEPLVKARKAKGLKKWGKLQHIAHKLEGKGQKDISFTTAYPGKEGQKKILGSVEGNLHFLMGYGNPGFHMAAYHWQVIDPNLSDEEAEEMHRVKGHPSRPEFWDRAELDKKAEGDLEDGMPHPSAIVEQKKAKRELEGVRVSVGAGTYLAVPSEGLVYGEHNDRIYKWDLFKDSFLAATNPDMVEAMNSVEEEEGVDKGISAVVTVPEMVKHQIDKASLDFDYEVYNLVKSCFPSPQSIIPLDVDTGETIYGIVTKSSIDFYDRLGNKVRILSNPQDSSYPWAHSFSSLDLIKGGDSHASTVYNFGINYLGLDRSSLEEHVDFHHEIKKLPQIVKGDPTPGFEHVPSEFTDSLKKSVEFVDNTYRLVVK